MRPRRVAMLLVCSCAALLHAGGQALPVATVPGLVWDRAFRSDTVAYELLSVAAAADSLWACVATRPRGKLAGPWRGVLWRLNDQGERVLEVDLATVDPAVGRSPDPLPACAMAALPGGDAALVLRSESRLRYLVVDRAGKASLTRTVVPPDADAALPRLRASGNSVLAVGRAGAGGWLLKLSAAGDVLASLQFDEVPFIEDAIETADGFVVLGQPLYTLGTGTWLRRVTSRGIVSATLPLDGNNVALSRGARGAGFVLVSQTRTPTGVLVVARGLSDTLATEWTGGPTQIVRAMRPFGVEAAGDVGALAAGEGPASSLWIFRVGRGGLPLWIYEGRDPGAAQSLLWNATVTPWGSDAIVGATLTVVRPNENQILEQRQIIELMRIRTSG